MRLTLTLASTEVPAGTDLFGEVRLVNVSDHSAAYRRNPNQLGPTMALVANTQIIGGRQVYTYDPTAPSTAPPAGETLAPGEARRWSFHIDSLRCPPKPLGSPGDFNPPRFLLPAGDYEAYASLDSDEGPLVARVAVRLGTPAPLKPCALQPAARGPSPLTLDLMGTSATTVHAGGSFTAAVIVSNFTQLGAARSGSYFAGSIRAALMRDGVIVGGLDDMVAPTPLTLTPLDQGKSTSINPTVDTFTCGTGSDGRRALPPGTYEVYAEALTPDGALLPRAFFSISVLPA